MDSTIILLALDPRFEEKLEAVQNVTDPWFTQEKGRVTYVWPTWMVKRSSQKKLILASRLAIVANVSDWPGLRFS